MAAAGPGYTAADRALPASARERIRRAVPDNTRRANTSRWNSFASWCLEQGRVWLPATEQTVTAYLDYLATVRELKSTTLDAHLSTIRVVHRVAGYAPPDPLHARKVVVDRALEEADDPDRPHGPRKALAMAPDQLRAAADACDDSAAGVRARAVLLLGYAVLARRSELAGLNITDVRLVRGKGLEVTIRRSKTDPSAKGQVRYVLYAPKQDRQYCPVEAVLAWRRLLRKEGIVSGPLFLRVDRWGNLGVAAGGGNYNPGARDGRLRGQSIGAIVTTAAAKAGLSAYDSDDEDREEGEFVLPGDAADVDDGEETAGGAALTRAFTGHSLRRGGATAMLRTGEDPLKVSRHGRWVDGSRAFAGYVETAEGFEGSPTAGLFTTARADHGTDSAP